MPIKAKLEDYQTITRQQLDKLAASACPCCGDVFTPETPPDLAAKCHLGPVFASYWDGYVYLTCHKCGQPVMRVAVATFS